MKHINYVLAFVALSLALLTPGCATGSLGVGPQESVELPHSKYCYYLDGKAGFNRCESPEAICYGIGGLEGGGQCWLKTPTSGAAPAEAKAPVKK